MGKINRLPTGLANQIAAGEVVERPASAVKELVENALDAGATRISVAIELGGKRLIRVEDNGEGMNVEDAVSALERHATSKLSTLEDLDAITTLGFRGEALPSIASVSRFTLKTRPIEVSQGTVVRVEDGATQKPQPIGTPPGTIVEVNDLFYNVPARRKFLKSDSAESSQTSRILTQLALTNPTVGFSLTSGRRQLLNCPRVTSLADRFFQLYGERTGLVEVKREAAGVRLVGYVAALAEQGVTRGPQNIFVNGRPVKDRTVSHAINEAYSRATIKPRSPEVHLFLELPHDRVDVNVHPMKAEVRFLEQSLIHEIVRRALGEALGADAPPDVSLRVGGKETAEAIPISIPGTVGGIRVSNPWIVNAEISEPPEPVTHRKPMVGVSNQVEKAIENRSPEFTAEQIGPALVPIGQFRDTFIIAVDNDGIVIIDQHVAHERVLFEQVMERLTSGPLESQRLLSPVMFELPAAQRDALEAHSKDLERLGFDVGNFGGDSVRVGAVPAVLVLGECEGAVRALAEDLEGLDHGASVDESLRRIAAMTACHAAVKANDRLTLEKMAHILTELQRTAYSTVCPHGRPVLLRLTRRELEKSFQRS